MPKNRKEDTELKKFKKEKYMVDKPSASPDKNHTCTDIICAILFLVFILVLVLVSVFAYINGKPMDLILPHDSSGRICGKTKGVEEKPYLLYFDLTKCLSVLTAINGCPTPQICVKQCPDKNSYEKIPSNLVYIKNFCDPYNNTICPRYLIKSKPVFGRCVPELIADVLNSTLDTAIQAFDSDNNVQVPIELDSNLNLTKSSLKESINYIKNLLNLKQTFELVIEDFTKTYWIILILLSISALLSFIWIFILRYLIKPLIYFSILIILCLLAFLVYFCSQQYSDLKNKSTNTDFKFKFEKLYDLEYLKYLKETWLALAIILGVLFLVLFFIIVFLRKRIQLSIEIIKEVSKAVVSIPSTLIWPCLPFLFEILVLVYCLSISIYLASSGIQLFKITDPNSTNLTFTTNLQLKVGDYCIPEEFSKLKQSLNRTEYETFQCTFYKFGFNTTLPVGLKNEIISKYYTKGIEIINKYQFIPQVYVFFMLFWLSAFMIGLNEMTLAGAFGIWYWTNSDKSLKHKLPFFTLLTSFLRSVIFHFGTIAFGSLLIAIIKMIRLILEYISDKLKSKTNNNKIVKYISCCFKCCFWCLEKFIKFLNRYAFIITATYSLNFCSSARKAFKLITENVLRILVVDKISNFILFLSNLSITSVVGLLSFYFFTKKIPIDSILEYAPDLNYYFLPIIVIVLISYGITKLFFDVFSIGIDTILICVLIDLDENDGTKSKPYYMSKNLMKILKITNRID